METARADGATAFPPLRFAFLLLVLICAAFPEIIFGRNTFCFRDFGLFGYPIAFHHRECFWRGEFPLWNPLNNCGMPFLAQWNTLVLYPGSLTYLLLPITWSLTAFCLAHLFLAGMTMYALARHWTRNQFAAAVAGLVFAFNGLTLNCLMWPNNIAALGWMPLVVLVVERAWREGGRKIIWAALVAAMQMLTGAPEIILLTWAILGTMAVAQFVLKLSPPLALARRFVFIVALGAGLSAAQLLPFLDLLHHSQRSANFGDSTWAMPATGWANLLVPLFRTFQVAQGVAFQPDQLWTSSYYAGIGALALAIFAAWQTRSRRVYFFIFIAAAGLLLALGNNGVLYLWVEKIAPLGFMRFPIKFVVLPIFALPLLAGFAVQKICATSPAGQEKLFLRASIVAALLLALTGAIIWYAHQFPTPYDKWPVILGNGLSRAAFLVLILGALFFAVRSPRVRLQRPAQWLFLALLGLDALTHAPRQNPSVPRAILAPGLAPLHRLTPQPRLGASRAALSLETSSKLQTSFTTNIATDYLVDRLCLNANCNLLEEIPKLGGFFSLYLPNTFDVILTDFNATNEMSGLKNFLGVSQISKPGAIGEWSSRTHFLPMVTAGQKPVFVSDELVLEKLAAPEFDATKTVYLPPDTQSAAFPTNAANIRIESAKCLAQAAAIKVQAEQPGLVIIAQAFYHPWRAQVDGKPTKIYRANHGFQAVQVPSGIHTIELSYRDDSFRLGCAISLGALLICLLTALANRRTGIAPTGRTCERNSPP
jgi:hypothetical protein